MEVIAKTRHVRQSARKMRLVADRVRNLSLTDAVIVVTHLNRRAARPFLLVFKQAIANAINNFQLQKDSLKIKKLVVGEGPSQKRWRFVGRGRVHPILKRTSHITLILEGEKAVQKKVDPVQKKTKAMIKKGKKISSKAKKDAKKKK